MFIATALAACGSGAPSGGPDVPEPESGPDAANGSEEIDLAAWRDHAREQVWPEDDEIARECADLYPDDLLTYIADFIGPEIYLVEVSTLMSEPSAECTFETADDDAPTHQALSLYTSYESSRCREIGQEIDHLDLSGSSSIEATTSEVCSEAGTHFTLDLRSDEGERGLPHMQSTDFAEQLLNAAVTFEGDVETGVRSIHEQIMAE